MMLAEAPRAALLARLAGMPDYLAEAFADLPASRHTEAGPDGSFSPVEHAWHLADLEDMGFAERIRRLRSEADPQLPDFAGDVVAIERNYKARSLATGIDAFRQARHRNLQSLGALTRAEWDRRGRQDGVGPVALCDLPAMMAEHDDSHRREIEQLLVFLRCGSAQS